MTLASRGSSPVQTPQVLDQRRRSERRACNLHATIVTRHGEIRGRIDNLSAGGAGISTDPVVSLWPGESFLLRSEQLGEIPCIVRWATHPRFGAEFAVTGQALAAAFQVYDQLRSSADGTDHAQGSSP